MGDMVEYDEQLSKETERGYLMPEIVNQRSRTIAALHLQAGEHVLDVGCGMGLLTQELALAVGTNGRILGIDNSPSMIKLAQKRCTDISQIDIQEASVTTLHEPDNSFDAVTCAQLLLYLPDVPKALAEMHRILKKGGRIAIVETDWRGVLFNTMDESFTKSLFDGWEASIPSPHLPGKLSMLLRQAGFTAVSVQGIPIINTSYLPDNYSAGMVTYMLRSELEKGRVTQEQADAYVADLKKRSDAGEYFFCVNRFLFTAVK